MKYKTSKELLDYINKHENKDDDFEATAERILKMPDESVQADNKTIKTIKKTA